MSRVGKNIPYAKVRKIWILDRRKSEEWSRSVGMRRRRRQKSLEVGVTRRKVGNKELRKLSRSVNSIVFFLGDAGVMKSEVGKIRGGMTNQTIADLPLRGNRRGRRRLLQEHFEASEFRAPKNERQIM